MKLHWFAFNHVTTAKHAHIQNLFNIEEFGNYGLQFAETITGMLGWNRLRLLLICIIQKQVKLALFLLAKQRFKLTVCLVYDAKVESLLSSISKTA